MARFDYDRSRQIARWPLHELLLAYLEMVKEQLREDLRHRQLLYQVRVAWGGSQGTQPPQVPTLLREPQS